MRILHTTDWHLGRTLHGHSRAREHEAYLDEIVDLSQEVDVVLVSGDVFETANPPIEAEELFFDALARLGDGGRRAVIVIAGNHDSPDRLTAGAPLAVRHGVWIFGRPGDVPEALPAAARRAGLRGPGMRWLASAPSSLTLEVSPQGPRESERVVVAALPYPSEARLRQLLSVPLTDVDRQRAYNERIERAFASLAVHYEPGAVNLAVSHLAVSSCLPRASERTLVGGAYQVEGRVLPASAQYVALGHLHLAQDVPDAPTLARYAGAPLSLRFSEREDPRLHTLVDVAPGAPATVTTLPIRAGRPLVVWEAGSLEEVHRGIGEGHHQEAFIDLRVHVGEHLTHAELGRLKALPRDIVRIQAILPESALTPLVAPEARRSMPTKDLFRAFFREQTGHEPDSALVDLFVELAGPAVGGSAADGLRQAG